MTTPPNPPTTNAPPDPSRQESEQPGDAAEASATHLLRALYGDTPKGQMTLWTSRGATYWPNDPADAARVGLRLAEDQDVYFGVGLRRRRLARGRGGAAAVASLPALWADIDILGPAHKADDLPPDEAAAKSILEAFGLAPSALVHTGYGLHAYWLLDVPYPVQSVKATRELLRSFGQALSAVAARSGWAIDTSVFEPARVLRLPGTINHKNGRRKPVRLLELRPARRHEIESIEAAIREILASSEIENGSDSSASASEKKPKGRTRTTSPGTDAPTAPARAAAYWRKALAEVEREFAQAADGKRNEELNRAAFDLASLVAAYRMMGWACFGEAEAWSALWRACQANGLAHDRDNGGERSCRATFDSGWEAGQKKPRELPQGLDEQAVARDLGVDPDTGEVLPGKPPPHCPPCRHRLTDVGNAARLVELYGDQLRYCGQLRKWLVWTGRRWRVDDRNRALALAKAAALGIFAEAAEAEKYLDEDAAVKLARWAKASSSRGKVTSALELAVDDLAVTVGGLDADPWTLNCLNGTVDLKTGELNPHDPADHLTCLAPVEYHPEADLGKPEPFAEAADCWRKFLNTTSVRDEGLTTFLQMATGLTLIGEPLENVLFFAHGVGQTGKSTFLDILLGVLGDYAAKVTGDALMVRSRSGGLRPEIAKLRGTRLVVCDETNKDRRLDVGLVNDLTGGAKITARALYQDEITFSRTFTPWIASNYRPELPEDERSGIWRRLREIPFDHVIPKEDRRNNMAAHVIGQAGPAVLAWAVRGALEYQRSGLPQVGRVEAATGQYKEAMDPLAEWLSERCILNAEAWAASNDLWLDYKKFSEDSGERPIRRREFGTRLERHGASQHRTNSTRGYAGVGLTDAHARHLRGLGAEGGTR